MEELEKAREYTLSLWKEDTSGRWKETRYRIIRQDGIAAVVHWLRDNWDGVVDSQVPLDRIPKQTLSGVLPDGREAHLDLETTLPIDPKPVVNGRSRENIRPAEIERLKGIFQEFRVLMTEETPQMKE